MPGVDTQRQDDLRLFIPLTKVDIEKRLVYGLATAEHVDLSGEVCDYATTKPNYEKWSEKVVKASGGRSLGNLRSMHGSTAAGKIVDIAFNDEDKAIEICAKVVDDNEWKKVQEGVYTGFSQGGRYAKRWTGEDGRSYYTADPSEVSLVDLPCLPNATFNVVKGEGLVEKRAFTTTVEEPDADHVKKVAEAIAEHIGEGHSWHEYADVASAAIMDYVMAKDFSESQHPRDGGGRFAATAAGAVSGGVKGAVSGGVRGALTYGAITAATGAFQGAVAGAAIGAARTGSVAGAVGGAIGGVVDVLRNPKVIGQIASSAARGAKLSAGIGGAVGAVTGAMEASSKSEEDTAEPKSGKKAKKFFDPEQKWDCGCADHTHVAKHEAVACMKKSAAEAEAAEIVSPVRGTLAKLEAELGITLAAEPEPEQEPRAALPRLEKGLSTVGRLASLIQELYYVQRECDYETESEKDASPLPAALQTVIETLSGILVQMATEESSELFEPAEGAYDAPAVMAMAAGLSEGQIGALIKISETVPELSKFGKALGETQGEAANRTFDRFVTEMQTLVKVGARNSVVDAERLQKAHNLLTDLGAECNSDDGDAKDSAGVEKLRAENDGLKKSVEDINARLGAVLDRVAELGKRAAPAKAAVRAVEKSDDDGTGTSMPSPTRTQAEAALKALSPADQASVLMKLALANPVAAIR